MDEEKDTLDPGAAPVEEPAAGTGGEALETAPDDAAPEGGTNPGRSQIEMIGDVSLPLTIELGCTRSSIKDILGFGPGTVIELDKAAGDPVDIYLYETRIAEGEIVIVREQYAVKVTSIVNKAGRIRDIQL